MVTILAKENETMKLLPEETVPEFRTQTYQT
jgi:hypothetical protein